jgi:hypothetical protein
VVVAVCPSPVRAPDQGAEIFILSVALTVLLLLEVLPSAGAQLAHYEPGIARLDGLTRLGLAEGRNLWVLRTLGSLHLIGGVAVILGIWIPAVGVAGAALEIALFGWVVYRQLRAGDRGGALFAYSLFTSMALAVLVVDALR